MSENISSEISQEQNKVRPDTKKGRESDQDIVGDVVNLSDPFPEDFAELFYEPKDIFGRPPPVEPFRFNVPSYVVIDSNSGDIFVADQNNRRMHRYNSEGDFITMWECDKFSGIVVDPRDNSLLVLIPGKRKLSDMVKKEKKISQFDLHVEGKKIVCY